MGGWIANLPGDLERQAALLSRLLAAAEAEPRIRAVELKGSLARGNADKYSDLDVSLWIADANYAEMLDELPALVRSLGDTIDILFETPGSAHLFVQYADGVQLELYAPPASESSDHVPGAVALLDPDGLLQEPVESRPPWDLDLWTGFAWTRLYDVDKLLRRGAVWEALNRLEEARARLLRHHAATIGAPDPQLGIISIMDAGGDLPEGLDATVAALDAADIRRAALACAELLASYDPRPFGTYVRQRLRSV